MSESNSFKTSAVTIGSGLVISGIGVAALANIKKDDTELKKAIKGVLGVGAIIGGALLASGYWQNRVGNRSDSRYENIADAGDMVVMGFAFDWW